MALKPRSARTKHKRSSSVTLQPPRASEEVAHRVKGLELPEERLRWTCSVRDLGVKSTDDVRPLEEIIGQDRALRALRVGLDVQQGGYNIFVTGISGTGRTTAIRRMLEDYAKRKVSLTDVCYVHNFRDPDMPMAITLPAGHGMVFRCDMAAFLTDLQKAIPAVFESRRYALQRKSVLEHFQDRQRSILRDFERKVKERGFEVVQVQASPNARPEIAYVVGGNPVSMEQLQASADTGELPREELVRVLTVQSELESQMDVVMREMRNIERKAKRSMDELNVKIVTPIVEELLQDLRVRHSSSKVSEYLVEVQKSILNSLSRFQQKEEGGPTITGLGFPQHHEEDNFVEYQVNVLVDNTGAKGPPIIFETNPRFKNIFGTIDRVFDRSGVWYTNLLQIKAGSIVKANGGFLVINAADALSEQGVWTMLKRILRNKKVEIQPIESGLMGASSTLKPEPIDLDVKVILIGDSEIYYTLFHLDEDFQQIFKVRADFDMEMPNNAKSIESYTSFIKGMCESDHLLALDGGAMAEIVEEGARLAGRQNKLSTRFSILADVLREAHHWALKRELKKISRAEIRQAIDERVHRVSMVEDKIQEMIDNGSILIDSDGMAVGQVNGLSVYQMGDFEFGRPTRITARTGMGRSGIINIEREAELSGPTHDKGVLILSGYLLGKFAATKPLHLSASVAFEQSYSGVDGDSASSTEIYALLSSLSGIPLRQDIAVTGSVNQHGEIQPIGGVNLKIEGFFDVCKARGLTGRQGVMIPQQNVADLMLRHEVVDAAREGMFHIYAVKTIDEGIEILTGRPAGKQTAKGGFLPINSVNALADARFVWLAKHARKH